MNSPRLNNFLSLFQTAFAFLFLLSFSALAQQPAPPKSPISDLKGAELYTTMLGHGKFVVHLKVYYACQAQVPVKEYVSLFETMGNRLISVLELGKDSVVNETGKPSTPCFPEKETCVKQVVYSAKADVGLAYMDYDLSWGYCCLDRGVVNLDHDNKQGFALMVHLPNPAIAQSNAMPSLNRLPAHHLCNNTTTAHSINFNNPDSDEVGFKLTNVSHYNVAGNTTYNYPQGKTPSLDQVTKDPVFTSSFLTNHPPFENIHYADGVTAEKPFASGAFNLDSKTGKMEIKPGAPGKYLVGITLEEKRNAKPLSEHAIVFITEIR